MVTPQPQRLTAARVKSIDVPGRYGDGGRGGYGLGLLVRANKSGGVRKSWGQRLKWHGQPFNLGLGSYPSVSLKDARVKAFENAKLISADIDPRAVPTTVPTLTDLMEQYIEVNRHTWKGDTNERKLRQNFGRSVLPKLGKLPVDSITPLDIKGVLEPVAKSSHGTYIKLKCWLNQIFGMAIIEGHRQDFSPTLGIGRVLPKAGEKRHRLALEDHAEIADTVQKIRQSDEHDYKRLALEMIILTAARSGEVRGMVWSEVNLDKAQWIVPAGRMKGSKEHRVPLSTQALAVLEQAKARWGCDPDSLVFPARRGGMQADVYLSQLLKRIGVRSTVHGFRSSFRNWAGESNVDRQIAEASLSHAIGTATELAYFRSDLFDLRRNVMQAWGGYATPTLS